jgi:hypothetical protein
MISTNWLRFVWQTFPVVLGLLGGLALSSPTFAQESQPPGGPVVVEGGKARADFAREPDEPGEMVPPYLGSCGDLSGLVSDGRVDPANLGFEMRLLDSDFQLLSLSFRSDAVCDENGEPVEQRVALDSSWEHAATSLAVGVSQWQAEEAIANVLDASSATFWHEGYAFTVWVQGYAYPAGPEPAVGEKPGEGAPPSDETPPDVIPPDGEPDPEEREVLLEAIAQLAGGLGEECFYRRVDGSWADLPSLGIGDPRPALPEGYSETSFYLSRLEEPAQSCASPVGDGVGGTSFYVSFANDSGGYVTVSAYEYGEDGGKSPGYIDDYGASWQGGGYQFSVYGARESEPLGRELIEAIAVALDPAFPDACLYENQVLSDEDVLALGLHVPVAPSGFTLAGSFLTAQVPSGDCSDSLGEPTYSLYWNFQDGAGAVIDASIFKYGASDGGVEGASGWISDYAISWTDEHGISYSVSGYAPDGQSIGRELLIEVALSMDPDLVIEDLEEGGGWEEPPPVPVPAQAAGPAD